METNKNMNNEDVDLVREWMQDWASTAEWALTSLSIEGCDSTQRGVVWENDPLRGGSRRNDFSRKSHFIKIWLFHQLLKSFFPLSPTWRKLSEDLSGLKSGSGKFDTTFSFCEWVENNDIVIILGFWNLSQNTRTNWTQSATIDFNSWATIPTKQLLIWSMMSGSPLGVSYI